MGGEESALTLVAARYIDILLLSVSFCYQPLPTVELSSSTTSTFRSLYSTLKSSIRGCLSTICLDGTTWRNAEDEEGVEDDEEGWLAGP